MVKLTPKVWKFIHRFVYLAYWGIIFHFLTMNPAALKTAPGYFLLAATFLALFGELFWYLKIAKQRGLKSLGTYIGVAIILLYLVTAYLAYS